MFACSANGQRNIKLPIGYVAAGGLAFNTSKNYQVSRYNQLYQLGRNVVSLNLKEIIPRQRSHSRDKSMFEARLHAYKSANGYCQYRVWGINSITIARISSLIEKVAIG